jgi:dienelactone hydrolase
MRKRLVLLLAVLSLSLTVGSCAERAPARDALEIGRALVSYDTALPLDAEVKEKAPREFHVVFSSTHGERIPALFWQPETPGPKVPCVILMHGLGGNKETMTPFAQFLTKQGYACIAIDAKYHGERPKGPAAFALLKLPYDGRDALAQTVVDLRRTIDYLASRGDIDMTRIGYIGYSMGALLGAIVSGVDARVACPVLIVGGGNWDALVSKSILPLAGDRDVKNADVRKGITDALAPLDPALWVGLISPRPVLMINGETDNIVPSASSKALHAAARQPKKIVWYPGGHMAPPDLLAKEIPAWFAEHLGGKR